jgi:hypothetical protein
MTTFRFFFRVYSVASGPAKVWSSSRDCHHVNGGFFWARQRSRVVHTEISLPPARWVSEGAPSEMTGDRDQRKPATVLWRLPSRFWSSES